MSQVDKFIAAIKENHLEQVKLRYHPDYLDAVYSGYFAGFRPIHFACQHGFVDITHFLLSKGCNLEAQTEMRMGPIHCAASKGHCVVIQLLLQYKCNIEAKGMKGFRAIHFAVQNGHFDAVKLLLFNNCDIEAEDNKGRRPIHIASKNKNLQICKFLIKNKCNIEAEDNAGLRPVHIAATRGGVDILRELMVNNCEGNPKTKFLATPLDGARHCNMEECVLMLERYNKDHSSVALVEKMDVKKLRENFERRSMTVNDATNLTSNTMCCLCVSTIKDCVLNCGHQFCCKCAEKMKQCRICDTVITHRRRSSCFIDLNQ